MKEFVLLFLSLFHDILSIYFIYIFIFIIIIILFFYLFFFFS